MDIPISRVSCSREAFASRRLVKEYLKVCQGYLIHQRLFRVFFQKKALFRCPSSKIGEVDLIGSSTKNTRGVVALNCYVLTFLKFIPSYMLMQLTNQALILTFFVKISALMMFAESVQSHLYILWC